MLTTDQDAVRKAGRAMLQIALSCRENMTNSGIVARIAGDARSRLHAGHVLRVIRDIERLERLPALPAVPQASAA